MNSKPCVAEILSEIIRTSLFTLDKSTEKAWPRHMQGRAWKKECVLALKFWEEWGSNGPVCFALCTKKSLGPEKAEANKGGTVTSILERRPSRPLGSDLKYCPFLCRI